MVRLLKRIIRIDLSAYGPETFSIERFRATFIVAGASIGIVCTIILAIAFSKDLFDVISCSFWICCQLVAIILIKNRVKLEIPAMIMGIGFLIFITGIVHFTYNTDITRIVWFYVIPPIVFFVNGKRGGLLISILQLLIVGSLFLFIPGSYTMIYQVRILVTLGMVIAATYGVELCRELAMRKLQEATRQYALKVKELSISERVRAAMEKKAIESAKMATLGEMAGGIAHEINGPLTVISGNARLLQKKVAHDDCTKEDLERYSHKILNTVDRVSLIVRGLKSFTRSSANDQMQSTSLSLILERSLSLCAEKLSFAQIRLSHHSVDESYQINCHETEISQVILNLIDNAHDALINQEEKKIDIESHATEGAIKLIITDNGPGVPKKIQKNIFKPFFTTKSVGKGTGLGLSISKDIIEKHGGSIEVLENNPGCRVVITLPLIQSSSLQESQ